MIQAHRNWYQTTADTQCPITWAIFPIVSQTLRQKLNKSPYLPTIVSCKALTWVIPCELLYGIWSLVPATVCDGRTETDMSPQLRRATRQQATLETDWNSSLISSTKIDDIIAFRHFRLWPEMTFHVQIFFRLWSKKFVFGYHETKIFGYCNLWL